MPAVVWLTNYPPAFKTAKTKNQVEGELRAPVLVLQQSPGEADGQGCVKPPAPPKHTSQQHPNKERVTMSRPVCHLPAVCQHGSHGEGAGKPARSQIVSNVG